MLRVLLVIDDYNEMTYLQVCLKKLGMDVVAVQSHRKVQENLLSLNPQIVVASARGHRVDAIKLGHELEFAKKNLKLVILKPTAQELSEEEITDSGAYEVLDSPVSIHSLLDVIANIANMDPQSLKDNNERLRSRGEDTSEEDGEVDEVEAFEEELKDYRKTVLGESFEDADGEGQNDSAASIELTPSTLDDDERTRRFENALKEADLPEETGFAKDRVRAMNKDLRRSEKKDELGDLEEERRSFVRALFEDDTEDSDS